MQSVESQGTMPIEKRPSTFARFPPRTLMFETKTSLCGASDPVSADLDNAPAPVFRPIQYLGSKLRSLPTLLQATGDLFGPDDAVFDLFSGSSVVSQAFARCGASVRSVDAQLFCQHLAGAMLGVGKSSNDDSCAAVAAEIVTALKNVTFPTEISVFLEQESRALSHGPAAELAHFYARLPQAWRNPTGIAWLADAEKQEGELGFDSVPIVASYYAGTYFGLYQALCCDYIRNEIERATSRVSEWVRAGLLTSLYSAMSKAVCSAGKHFAQPLGKLQNANPGFYHSRLSSDRRIDIANAFLDAARNVDAASLNAPNRHVAIVAPVEDVYATIRSARPKLIYADPPYTAQQYSRFYHILEVVANYRVPKLQMVGGGVTTGLYNEGRYKSDFSSKSKAKSAFTELIKAAKDSGASLVMSYSSSSERSTGNARMITLDELIKLCNTSYGTKKTRISLHDHVYRQFNATAYSNAHRNDPEILIMCEA